MEIKVFLFQLCVSASVLKLIDHNANTYCSTLPSIKVLQWIVIFILTAYHGNSKVFWLGAFTKVIMCLVWGQCSDDNIRLGEISRLRPNFNNLWLFLTDYLFFEINNFLGKPFMLMIFFVQNGQILNRYLSHPVTLVSFDVINSDTQN